jgi:putative aldouronate transport system substrate-binding protein
MKISKKVLSLVICLGIVMSLFSFTIVQAADTKSLPKAQLVWYFPGNFPQADQDDVFAAVNEKVKAKINAEVDFRAVPFGDYDQKMQVTIASGEAYDICFSANWINNYNQNVAKGAFAPLDNLLKTYAPVAYKNVPEAMWNATKINGKIYGFINQQISARTPDLIPVKSDYDKYKIDFSKFAGKLNIFNLNLLEPYIQKVRKDQPQKGFYTALSHIGGEFMNMEWISGWNTPGVVKFSDKTITVINQFESAEYKAYRKLTEDWNKKGYLNSKIRLSKKPDEWWTDAKANKVALILGGAFKPGGAVENSGLAGYPCLSFQSGTSYLTTGGIIATMQAISRNSENPERAMMLLEYLNTDKDVYNTLNFGIKGVHYTVDSQGFMIKEGDKAKAYNPSVPWMFATNFLAIPFKGTPKSIWDDTKKINSTAVASQLLGFSFNAEPIKTEIAKTSAVVDEYVRSIDYGTCSEAKYNEFLNKLKKAGSAKIITEMQKQINAWKK